MSTHTAPINSQASKFGTAVRTTNGKGGIPCYLVTVGNETRLVEVVVAGDWTGHVSRDAGDHVAFEAYRLNFPQRFMICVDEKTWKA